MKHIATGAEDQAQKKWHQQLVSVLAWLLPEHSAEHQITQSSVPSAASANIPTDPPPPSIAVKPEVHDANSTDAHTTDTNSADPCGREANSADAIKHPADATGNAQAAVGFDAAEVYAAVKPTGLEPELSTGSTQLKPTLRPYQKRAAAWMVAREQQPQVVPCRSTTLHYALNTKACAPTLACLHNVHLLVKKKNTYTCRRR